MLAISDQLILYKLISYRMSRAGYLEIQYDNTLVVPAILNLALRLLCFPNLYESHYN